MKIIYIYFYNKLINLTTNKKLYKSLDKQDSFNDRLLLFLFHFAFFLKVFKFEENETNLQEIYDFNFRQLELSIREIGYGDQSINKKMKDYINVFHAIVSDIHFWDNLENLRKKEIMSKFLENFKNIEELVDYFDDYSLNLSKNTLSQCLHVNVICSTWLFIYLVKSELHAYFLLHC
jgi:cytochrome b pre-mRNA-processing protein 3